MNMFDFEPNWQIEKIEWAALPGKRARHAGSNARIGEHGVDVPLHLARITIAGQEGCGWSRISKPLAQELVGQKARDLFNERGTVREVFRGIEFPLFDWIGRAQGKPLNSLLSAGGAVQEKVACYDTSLYFDDLHLSDERAAVEFMKMEALEGKNRGQANFKLKVGRGGRHMPLTEGTKRDIAIIRGIREAAGPHGKIMIDANNGYNLNLTKHVLQETADVQLYWIEEAFHEDAELYKDLKAWMRKAGMNVLIADGEGLAAPPLVQWAKEGIVDVVQYDVLAPGFSYWLELGPELDAAHVKSAPHSYGTPYGHYVLSHLASAIKGFQFVEWDQIEVEGMDASGYRVKDGFVHVPSEPGFGLKFDSAYVSKWVQETGWTTSR